MPVHPNPISMAVHCESRRQDLLDQARLHRLAKEASAGGGRSRLEVAETRAVAVGRARSVLARLRPALVEPVEGPQSAPGEAL